MLKNYVKLIIALFFVSNVMGQNVPTYVPKNGLVGWWPFNGSANDESGNGNHGTVNGATLTTDRNGKANSAYSFDGKSNIQIKNSLSLSNLTSDATFSFWFKINDYYNNMWATFFCKSINSSQTQFRIAYNNKDKNIDVIYNGKTYYFAENIQSNQYVNLIMVVTNNTIKLSVNGVLSKNNISVGTYPSSTSMDILLGQDTPGYNEYYIGELDDIAIFNRALSDQEIKQLYEGCTKETATSSSFNSVVYTTNTPVNLSANPTGGSFNGEAVSNNSFNPSKAKLGKNQVKYNFKNSTGCADSTNFTMILVDTLGNKCTETIYDTIKVKESTYDTLKIKVQLTTGIKAGQLTSMNVYPNPASELLIIEANDIKALSGYKYKIVDLQGKEVYNALATTAKTEISLKSIGAKGMYILHIVDEKGVSIENKKIVLE